ncbi:hypothetical protein LY76DRAFT_324844 [Colletotrichum caudatum]|nr:hypothetical protein LY76DRAFT_324844 [Colletotrichum caudatum]
MVCVCVCVCGCVYDGGEQASQSVTGPLFFVPEVCQVEYRYSCIQRGRKISDGKSGTTLTGRALFGFPPTDISNVPFTVSVSSSGQTTPFGVCVPTRSVPSLIFRG